MLTLGRKTLSVPILQGGMGVGVSLGGLAGAVAACGGMGCMGAMIFIFGYPSMTSNIILAPSLKLFWKIRQSVMV